jgi:hypothetical protein
VAAVASLISDREESLAMGRHEDSRIVAFVAVCILTVLTMVVGTHAFDGLIGETLIFTSVGLNLLNAVACTLVPDKFNGDSAFVLGFVNFIVSIICGLVLFGSWGLAYAVSVIVLFMLSCAARQRHGN